MDILELASGNISNPVDLVAFPETEDDIIRLFDYCGKHNVVCIPFGGKYFRRKRLNWTMFELDEQVAVLSFGESIHLRIAMDIVARSRWT